jgi:hypothetical protein
LHDGAARALQEIVIGERHLAYGCGWTTRNPAAFGAWISGLASLARAPE